MKKVSNINVNEKQEKIIRDWLYLLDRSIFSSRFSENNKNLSVTLLYLKHKNIFYSPRKSGQAFELLYYAVGIETKFRLTLDNILSELFYRDISMEAFYSTYPPQSFVSSIQQYLDRRVELKNRTKLG
ncbi:hypothetical protein GC096_08315 [Paenibacillus sp. LMG 31461]|uniref:Uncharacterized protein n=1 Tax=Paenibacillus plantarum TaxID=2654975 RepID=A0ABX1X729_9BACL|nr:hypothetical protein [Paenibacillus plantarum]NOU64026.1 hypothetical protein [Paenibacillus plantarum]